MSVESAAIKDCILVVHDVMTPLRKLLLDCMEQQYGSMLPKAESEKYNVTIHTLIKDRETATLLKQQDVGAYYELRKEALSYRITPDQLLLDRIEATKKNLRNVRLLYKQRLESQIRDIKVTVAAAGSTKCQIVRSRLAGAFCFYGDFWNTSEYRIDSPWNKAYVEKT